MAKKIQIYTDGASRGNPGPASAGYTIDGVAYGEALGVQTNNYAEYMAIILALKKAQQLLGKKGAKGAEVEIFMDSQLAVRQLNGEYKIKNEGIIPLFIQVWNLRSDFAKVTFAHVPREENKEADAAANMALDK